MQDPADPYTPPPRHRDRSGVLVRLTIVAALLATGAFAYTQFVEPRQEAARLEAAQLEAERAYADAGRAIRPSDSVFDDSGETTPQDEPAETSAGQDAAPEPPQS